MVRGAPGGCEGAAGVGDPTGGELTIPINQGGAMLVDWKVPFERAGFDDIELAVDHWSIITCR